MCVMCVACVCVCVCVCVWCMCTCSLSMLKCLHGCVFNWSNLVECGNFKSSYGVVDVDPTGAHYHCLLITKQLLALHYPKLAFII